LGKVVEISGVDREALYAECSVIHQKYGTSEYSRLLGELPCLQKLYGDNVLQVVAPAIDAFRDARRHALQLYPTVHETLEALKAAGIVIAAFTESKAFYTNYRFRKLDLDGLIDYLYSPEDHSMPDDTPGTRYYDEPDTYKFKKTIHRFTPEGEVKPNPDILLEIISDLARQSTRRSTSATIFSRMFSWPGRPVSPMFMRSTAPASTSRNMNFYAKLPIGHPRWSSANVTR
jgi:hypothetical protein